MKNKIPEPKNFLGKVIKQGNSLCIRIPFKTVRKLKLREGSFVASSILSYDKFDLPQEVIACYRKLPDFAGYSSELIKEYLVMFSIEKQSHKNTIKDEDYKRFKRALKKNKEALRHMILKTKYAKKLKSYKK